MSTLCPVCNGLEQFQPSCSQCGGNAEDCGKHNDFLGPYAPYRPIDDLKLTDGFIDLETHQCVHVLYCPQCGTTSNAAIQEWSMQVKK